MIEDLIDNLEDDRDTLVANLTTKGISGLTGDETFTELAPKVLDIVGVNEVPEKDVNLYDYDGTRLYSYTAQEFLALTAFPANPSHSGLTSQGWNWDLSDAQTVVGEMGMLNIGQNYITDDNKTRIYIELLEERKSPTLRFAGTTGSTLTVDWGDNSTAETVTATNNLMTFQHTYSTAGNYVITISGSDVIIISGDTSQYCTYLLSNNESGSATANAAYSSAIKKIELGQDVRLNDAAFASCYSLETITMPQIVRPNYNDPLYNHTFRNCYSLKNFVFPKNGYNNKGYFARESHFENCYSLKRTQPCKISGYGSYCFKNCGGLDEKMILGHKYVTIVMGYTLYECNTVKEVYADTNIGSITTGGFSNCRSLNKIVCFGNITSIEYNSFPYTYALKVLDLRRNTSIPTVGVNTFNGIDCQIIVPDALYDDWIVSGNWPSFASKVVRVSDL